MTQEKCYSCGGKGTYSQMHGLHGAVDFGLDGFDLPPGVHNYPCKACDGTGMKKVMTQDWKTKFRKLWSSIGKDNQHLTTERIEDLIESLLKEERNAVFSEERQFILNILDGIDIADKQMGLIGGTQAIRQALQSRPNNNKKKIMEKYISKIEKEFDETSFKWVDLEDENGRYILESQVKSFLKQSFIKYLQKQLEVTKRQQADPFTESEDFLDGFALCKSKTIATLEAQIKEIDTN